MNRVNLFEDYSAEQATAIRQALKDAVSAELLEQNHIDRKAADLSQALEAEHLKIDTNWERTLFDITVAVADVYDGPCAPDRAISRSEVAKQSGAFTRSLEVALQAHDRQAVGLQAHQNEHQSQIVGFVESGKEWAKIISQLTGEHHCPQPVPQGYTVRRLLEAALTAVRLAEKKPNPHIRTSKKNYVIRLLVRELMDIFKAATGIEPIVYVSSYKKSPTDGCEYKGSFYPFAVACLSPVFPAEELSSAILTAYNEARKGESPYPAMGHSLFS